MKIAIIYNRDSQAVINLFGMPNREKYGLQTIKRIKEALEAHGHQVQAFEGDKNIIYALEDFMPSVISGERPGLVFNLSYGIQGRARYTHIPGILEMLGIPYVGSSPETHAIALDKVLTKIVLTQKNLPTPKFTVLESPDFEFPLQEEMTFPFIVKPRDEAVSLGIKIVHDEAGLREWVRAIYEMFQAPALVEEYIEGREINVGLLGNSPVEALPPVEMIFYRGPRIYTHEDKVKKSRRRIDKVCPASLDPAQEELLKTLSIQAFNALGCFDSARVDFRLDREGNPYILEVNSMASLGPDASYVFAAEKMGLDYAALVNRLIEITSQRYFGPIIADDGLDDLYKGRGKAVFTHLIQRRDQMEEELKGWTNLPSWTEDAAGLGAVIKRLEAKMHDLGLHSIKELTNQRFAWAWQTAPGLEDGTLLVASVDVPRSDTSGYPTPFRKAPEQIFGEGIASSRAGLLCLLETLQALKTAGCLHHIPLGVFIYADEGRGMRYSSPTFSQAAEKAGQVLVMQSGLHGGKVVDQRRGSRKFSILVEGAFQRIGYHRGPGDLMNWFLQRAARVGKLSMPKKRLTVAVQEVHSERYSVLLPHRIRATVYVTFLDPALAGDAETEIRKIFTPTEKEEFLCYVEKLEERPALTRSESAASLISKLKAISADWKLPFGVDSSLLPSAAGVVPEGIPVLCGLAPSSQNMYTPFESIQRGELLQRALLLTLFLMEGQVE